MAREVRVRLATSDDLEQLTVLFEGYRKFYKQEPNPERTKNYLSTRLQRKDSVIYVGETLDEVNTLLGFTQLYPLLDSLKLGNKWLLNDLYVDPEARGTGLGKKLLAQGKTLAKETNATGVQLTTQKSNKIGNSLYPSQGWKLDEEFNHYGWHQEDFAGTGPTGLVLGEVGNK